MKKLFIFFSGFTFLILTACNTSQTPKEDPKIVLTHFLTALSQKDMVKVKKYVTKDSEGMVNMMQMSFKNMESSEASNQFDPSQMEIGEAMINGDGNEAQVPVSQKNSDEKMNFILQKENGAWKVAFNFETLRRMAKEKMEEKGINPGNLDSMMKNVPKEEIEKAQKLLDSIGQNMKGISRDHLEEAKKMLDSLAQQK